MTYQTTVLSSLVVLTLRSVISHLMANILNRVSRNNGVLVKGK